MVTHDTVTYQQECNSKVWNEVQIIHMTLPILVITYGIRSLPNKPHTMIAASICGGKKTQLRLLQQVK